MPSDASEMQHNSMRRARFGKLNAHGVPAIYGFLALTFLLFAYWSAVREDIYEVGANALLDESIVEVDSLLTTLKPVTSRIDPAAPWTKGAKDETSASRIRLKFPSYLSVFVQYDSATGLIDETTYIYFASEDVHPDTGDRFIEGMGSGWRQLIAYSLVAIALWYTMQTIRSQMLVSIARWFIGLLLIPPGVMALVGSVHFWLCFHLSR